MKTKRQDYTLVKQNDIYSITASTADVDRDGEVIMPSAFKSSLPRYLEKNPVILWGHDYGEKPVGKATGGRITERSMELDIEFAPTDLGKEVKALYDGGFMNSFSVGFIPQDGHYDEKTQAFTYTECELLEVSCVTVPSNRAATMMREAESKGFSVSEIRKSIGVVGPVDTEDEDEVPEVPDDGEVAKSPYSGIGFKYLRS